MTPEQFQRDLIELYALAAPYYNNRALPTEYLAQLIKAIVSRLPNLPNGDAYRLYLQTHIQSLVSFTKAYPFRRPAAQPLFSTAVSVLDKSGNVEPRFHAAVVELCQPFRKQCAAFEPAGISTSTWAPYGYFEFSQPKPTEPLYGDTIQRRIWRQETEAWRDQQRRHERDRKQVLAEMTALQQLFIHTPYYPIANHFIPSNCAEPFDIPEKSWFESCWVVGASGAGKSNLLRHVILHRLTQNATIIIIDSKGNLDLLRSFHRLYDLRDRLVNLRSSPQHPLAINPFDTPHPDEFLEYLFSIFNAGLTANQTIPFSSVIRLLRKTKEPTLKKFWQILAFGTAGYEEEIKQLSESDQHFFSHDMRDASFKARASEVRARLKLLIDHDILGPVLSSTETRVKMDELLESGKVICIDNSTISLGTSGAEFMGRLFLALIWYAGQQRRGNKPVYVFLDEAYHFVKWDRRVGDMIASLRSQRIALCFAHQWVGQIKDADALDGLKSCGIKFFNTTGETVSAATYFPGADPEVYNNLPRGSFATFVKFKPSGNFNVIPVQSHKVIDPEDTVPTDPDIHTFADTKTYPLMADRLHDELIRDMHKTYCAQSPGPQPEAQAPSPPQQADPQPKEIAANAEHPTSEAKPDIPGFDFSELIRQRYPRSGPQSNDKPSSKSGKRAKSPPPPSDVLEDW